MDTQTVCRICKTEGVRLHCITNTYLQEIYEHDAGTLVPTEDRKPILACITCCDRLQHCHQVRSSCEQRENALTMMVSDDKHSNTNMSAISPVEHHNNTCIAQSDVHKYIKKEPEHFIEIEVKQECITHDETGQQNDASLKEDSEKSETGLLPRIVNVKSENKIEIEIEPYEMSTNEKQAPTQATATKTYEDTTHKKNKLTAGKTAKRSRYEKSRKQPNRMRSDDKNLECDLCNKHFNTKSRLITHIRIHTGEKPFKCNICTKSFNQKGHLIIHNRIHTGDRPYKCNICSKSFTGKGSLVKHNRIHTGDKPYKCNICSKCFNQKSNLILHNSIHTGDKPYKCNICGKAFNQKISLVKHTGTHAKDNPNKIYFNNYVIQDIP